MLGGAHLFWAALNRPMEIQHINQLDEVIHSEQMMPNLYGKSQQQVEIWLVEGTLQLDSNSYVFRGHVRKLSS